MARWGMVIDLDRCNGCGGCMAACHKENNLAAVGADETVGMDRAFHWLKILPEVSGSGAEAEVRHVPHMCVQCDNPPCIRVCPVHATYLGEEGIVGQVYSRCIGCRYCMAACPYNAKVFNWYEPEWPGDLKKAANPDVSLRPKGVVEKCTFCHHRVVRAREEARAAGRPIADGEVTTACAETCPTKAITFGDLDDPDSRVRRLSRSSRAFRPHADLGTEPKVFYLAKKE
ncbi:MAG: 4Fe-4S dicluster domain-containing protein [Acidobacteria bacterium]|nr:4Fe-4S dicluster domain-containing protein [Acidobacteriota bacterium]NIO60811.1 4Fe-4S dicluster domain-containing protein [Acidobacteriota bacterium]NIQ31883.1 4Fe-4S dicluster domain-containing protein [Acidobacteriota bacterium]NIQ87263.1 4Fe-4S dicluster domain-containing protein [Acidobacteriota bacterium]NIT12479.1 4Fe-4S dicluster domain-containing protein [Acidobacteriota bacterium]